MSPSVLFIGRDLGCRLALVELPGDVARVDTVAEARGHLLAPGVLGSWVILYAEDVALQYRPGGPGHARGGTAPLGSGWGPIFVLTASAAVPATLWPAAVSLRARGVLQLPIALPALRRLAAGATVMAAR